MKKREGEKTEDMKDIKLSIGGRGHTGNMEDTGNIEDIKDTGDMKT